MNLTESVAVRRHLLRHLKRIEAAAKLAPRRPWQDAMMFPDEEQAKKESRWRQDAQLLVAGSGLAITLLGSVLEKPVWRVALVVLGVAIVIVASAYMLLRLARRRRERFNNESIQMRRAAVVLRAAELADELVSGAQNENDKQPGSLLLAVGHARNQQSLSERLSLAAEAVKSTSRLILSRGVTVGPDYAHERALHEEARALHEPVASLHRVVVDIVQTWLDDPPATSSKKDSAHPAYSRYSRFWSDYVANAGGWDLWAGDGPFGTRGSATLPPFAR